MVQQPGSATPFGMVLFEVDSPSGYKVEVMQSAEADWYEDRRDRYVTDNHFPNVSDLMDLDRLLMFELMMYRWTIWQGRGFDYLHARVDEGQLKTAMREFSTETRLLKQSLGIDKATRDKDKGESLADYTANLLERARIFGIHRNEQYEIVVTKFYEMRSLILTFDRCDAQEREHLELSLESIVQWIRDHVIKDFDELSAAFRENQKMWVKEI